MSDRSGDDEPCGTDTEGADDKKAVAQLATATEVSHAAAEALLDACGWDMDEAFETFFGGRFTREDLEAHAAKVRKEPAPACQYYWNGHCAKGDACALRHASDGAGRAASPSRGLFTRDPEGMAYEELLDLQDAMGRVELSVSADVRAVLRRGRYSPSRPHAPSHTVCSVCLDDFARGDATLQLPCNHTFHAACIDRCMDCSKSCPVCKREIVAPATDPDPDPDTSLL